MLLFIFCLTRGETQSRILYSIDHALCVLFLVLYISPTTTTATIQQQHNTNPNVQIFVVADGGIDLEHFEPQSFAEIRSILLQTTMTLAVAEESCEFEHRDLHWGNILVTRDGTPSVPYRVRNVDITVPAEGVRVTLIDFTLSRLITSDGEVAFCDLSADPELFKGPKGDEQAETYRRMQKLTKDDWQQYVPMTNAFWLRYLADIIMAHKLPHLCSGEDRMLLKNFRKLAMGARGASDMMWAEMFKGAWTSSSDPMMLLSSRC